MGSTLAFSTRMPGETMMQSIRLVGVSAGKVTPGPSPPSRRASVQTSVSGASSGASGTALKSPKRTAGAGVLLQLKGFQPLASAALRDRVGDLVARSSLTEASDQGSQALRAGGLCPGEAVPSSSAIGIPGSVCSLAKRYTMAGPMRSWPEDSKHSTPHMRHIQSVSSRNPHRSQQPQRPCGSTHPRGMM